MIIIIIIHCSCRLLAVRKNCVKLISGPVETALRDRVPDLNSRAAPHVDYIVSVGFRLVICSWLAILHYNATLRAITRKWDECGGWHYYYYHQSVTIVTCVIVCTAQCAKLCMDAMRIIRTNGGLLVCVCVYCNIYSAITDAALVPVIHCTRVWCATRCFSMSASDPSVLPAGAGARRVTSQVPRAYVY